MATHGSTIPTCAGLPTTCTARLRTTFFWLVFQVSDSIPTPFCCRSWCRSWRLACARTVLCNPLIPISTRALLFLHRATVIVRPRFAHGRSIFLACSFAPLACFSLLTANKISQVEVIVIDTYRPAAERIYLLESLEL
jgi:hypothetical protein